MSFSEKYSRALTARNLTNDAVHSSTDSLTASAISDIRVGGLGSALTRLKASLTSSGKIGEPERARLADALKAWRAEVRKKGIERKWLPTPRTTWDAAAHEAFYTKVAELSLAHWLDGKCEPCGGTGKATINCTCKACNGTGRATVKGERLVVQRTLDMLSDLVGLVGAHGARAASMLRETSLVRRSQRSQ
ncbi:hypothetical protein [Duganella sp. S19_KUP01_CR8]|uniref:hypothetical protein n=1 Tax=Duganella sp. S19_KUP01_CR8 TaxID=3025502 RepID=UPI002FCD9CF5